MSQQDIRKNTCSNCGAPLKLMDDGKTRLCPACDTLFDVDDHVIKHVIEGSVAIEGLTTKTQLHKRAQVALEDGSFSDAARYFHEIIDNHDADDAEAWWGLACVSVDNFTNIDKPIIRAQLGKNYIKALDCATPEQRAKFERIIDEHAKRHAELKAEIIAKEEVERKLREAQLEAEKRERAEKEAAARREREAKDAAERREREKREEAKRAQLAAEEAARRKQLEKEQRELEKIAKEKEKEEERLERERKKLERERLIEQEEMELRREKEERKRERYQRKRNSGYVRLGHKLNWIVFFAAFVLLIVCFPPCRSALSNVTRDFPFIASFFESIDGIVDDVIELPFMPEILSNYVSISANYGIYLFYNYSMILLLLTAAVIACALPFGTHPTHRAVKRWLFWLTAAIIAFAIYIIGISSDMQDRVYAVLNITIKQDMIELVLKQLAGCAAAFALGLVTNMFYGAQVRRVTNYLNTRR